MAKPVNQGQRKKRLARRTQVDHFQVRARFAHYQRTVAVRVREVDAEAVSEHRPSILAINNGDIDIEAAF